VPARLSVAWCLAGTPEAAAVRSLYPRGRCSAQPVLLAPGPWPLRSPAAPTTQTLPRRRLAAAAQVPSDKSASGLEVEVPMPKYVQRIHCDIDPKQAGVRARGCRPWWEGLALLGLLGRPGWASTAPGRAPGTTPAAAARLAAPVLSARRPPLHTTPTPHQHHTTHHATTATTTPQVQSGEYVEKQHLLRWRFKKMAGGAEATLRCRWGLAPCGWRACLRGPPRGPGSARAPRAARRQLCPLPAP
jgi:hypothetical protein